MGNAILALSRRLVWLSIFWWRTSVLSISHGGCLCVGIDVQGSNIGCVRHSQPSLGHPCFYFYSISLRVCIIRLHLTSLRMPHMSSCGAHGNWWEMHTTGKTLLVARIQTLFSLWNLPCRSLELSDLVRKNCRGYFMDPELSQGYLKVDSSFTLGFMGLWFVFPLSVQEKMGLLVGRDHLIHFLFPHLPICPLVHLMSPLGGPWLEFWWKW